MRLKINILKATKEQQDKQIKDLLDLISVFDSTRATESFSETAKKAVATAQDITVQRKQEKIMSDFTKSMQRIN